MPFLVHTTDEPTYLPKKIYNIWLYLDCIRHFQEQPHEANFFKEN